MFEKVKEIILEQLDINENEIKLESRIIEDFGADSLDLMELSESISTEFNVEFTKEDLKNIKTVQDLISLIENKK